MKPSSENDSKNKPDSDQPLTNSQLEALSLEALELLEYGENLPALDKLNRILRQEPEHQLTLWRRSVAFLGLGELSAALDDLYLLLKLNPSNLEARNQIRYIHRKLVGSWHFDMMNDQQRNAAFEKAIRAVVTKESIVIEIGTGSGLLAMMAARAGAKHVYTIERTMPVAKAAREIIRRNGLADKITLIEASSTNVQIPRDIPEQADVLIGELFGPALLDEEALHYFALARKEFLKPNGHLLPQRAVMMGALVESEKIHQRTIVGQVSGFDVSLFNALHEDPALQMVLSEHAHTILSEPFEIGAIQFGITEDTVEQRPITVVPNKDGTCHACVQWFRLYLNEDTVIDTSPYLPRTHWEQHVQVYERPFKIKASEPLTLISWRLPDRYSVRRQS